MVLMPHWMVCFWTGSSAVLEKFDLGSGEGSAQLSSRSIYFHSVGVRGMGDLSLLDSFTLTLANQECHKKRQNHLAKPLSAHQHHDMGRQLDILSEEISFWAQPVFKWVLCHFSVADSDPFGSQT